MKTFKELREQLNVKTHTPKDVAKKHKVDVDTIHKQLKMGIKVEKEHTFDPKVAREIALDHLGEKPDYYTRLKKVEGNKMLSVKDYIVEQDYIDWDYVFGFIVEQEDEPSFKVERDDEGTERHTHIFTVPKITGKGSHEVRVNITKSRYKNRQIAHHVSFDVDGSVEVDRAKRMLGKQRMEILRGVKRAVTSYATKNVKPGHSIVAGSGDPNSGDEERKARVQGEFFKKLTNHLGKHLGREATYHNYGGAIHEIRIPKQRKVVPKRKSVLDQYGLK